jgi:acyl-CoA oxidase
MGVQSFLIPVRDMDTHRPLPGIEVGDIGPKFGFAAKDNGYAIFKNVRIPRRNMLMRYVNVDREGKVTPQGNPKVLYSVMMYTRL